MCLFVNNTELFFYELKKELPKEYNYLLSEFCQTATFFHTWESWFEIISKETGISISKIQRDIQYLLDNEYLYVGYYDGRDKLSFKPKQTFFQKLKTKLYEYIRIFNRRKPTNNSQIWNPHKKEK